MRKLINWFKYKEFTFYFWSLRYKEYWSFGFAKTWFQGDICGQFGIGPIILTWIICTERPDNNCGKDFNYETD